MIVVPGLSDQRQCDPLPDGMVEGEPECVSRSAEVNCLIEYNGTAVA
jgi:hypothetical protein